MVRFENDLAFGLVLCVLFGMLGVFLLTLTRHHRQGLKEQVQLFVVALIMRFTVSIVIYEFDFVKVLGDEDSSGWLAGCALAQRWWQRQVGLLDLPAQLAGAFDGLHQGYAYMAGALFYLIGSPARLPAAALNCFFGALTVIFAYRIARMLFSPWVATRVGWVACFFPSLLVWSAQTLKEPVVIFLETVALYACLHLKLSGFSLRYLVLCGAAIVLLLPFRFYAAYIAAAAAALALALPQMSKRRFTFISSAAVIALFVTLVISSGVLARNQAIFERFNLQMAHDFRYNIGKDTGSKVDSGYDVRTPSGLILGTAIGAAHLALAPFPWQLGGGSLRMLLTLPELLVWWYLFFAGLLPGIWRAIRQRFNEIQPLLFFIAGLGLLYSMLFGNIGLIFRQRAQLLPWLLIFAMVGLEQRGQRRRLKEQALAAGDLPLASQWRTTSGVIGELK